MRLSIRTPLAVRKTAGKIRQHPKLARRAGYYLIYEDGSMAGRLHGQDMLRHRRDSLKEP